MPKSQSISFPSHFPLGNHKFVLYVYEFVSVFFSSVQLLSHVWFCSPMDCSTPGFPVHHQLPELAQTYVHQVSDAIQPSHPLVSRVSSCLQSFPASVSFLMSQFFPSGGQSFGTSVSASVLSMNIQDWFPLGSIGLTLAVQGTLKSLLHSSNFKLEFELLNTVEPQLKSINSLALSFLISVYNYCFVDRFSCVIF